MESHHSCKSKGRSYLRKRPVLIKNNAINGSLTIYSIEITAFL